MLEDIKNIVKDKKQLGLLDDFTFSNLSEELDPELIFVFHPDENFQIEEFSNELKNRHKLLIVSDSNYKLS